MLHLKLCGFTEKQRLALEELTEICGIVPDDGAAHTLTITRGAPKLRAENGNYTIVCETPASLWRLLSQLQNASGRLSEGTHKGMLCYMCDESRNAVTTVKTTKKLLRELAVMGYNAMMLYTEDTYTVEGYPAFGAMRGRYTEAELRELDDYAELFGIELIPCIQTLAHLETALRHAQLAELRDTEKVLLTDSEATYRFLDACMKACRRCFRSRRINIGMDEAYGLGTGKALRRDGYVPAPERMLKHLQRVVGLCTENGYRPMMWSDMFFRMAFDGKYYVAEGEISAEVMAKVPKEVTLVYWDYYNEDRKLFEHMVDCHRKFGNEIVLAGGAWKWFGFAPHNRFGIGVTGMQLSVCARRGLSDIIMTAWGDNGAEASQFSAMPTLLYAAETLYQPELTETVLDRRCRECFGLSMEAFLTLDAPNELPLVRTVGSHPCNPSRYLLYNDPLEGLMDCHLDAATAADGFRRAAERLRKQEDSGQFGYVFSTLARLCELLTDKATLTVDLRRAYGKGDREALKQTAEVRLPRILTELEAFITALRKQWFTENKSFGFTTLELRLGGLMERIRSAKLRLEAYLSGACDAIEELEEEPLSVDGKTAAERGTPYLHYMKWTQTASSGVL